MTKIAYITAKIPFGPQESFILAEILALKRMGADMLIIPRDRSDELFHKNAESLLNDTLTIPWFDIKIAKESLKYIYRNPASFFQIMNDVAFRTRDARITIKNLIILPKAIYLSAIFKRRSISHIHAHWASTTSTMAYIISEITGIPWSFTVHRWDIPEDNILKDKCRTASFVRAIDKKGHQEIIEMVSTTSLIDRISVIHMGVDISKGIRKSKILTEVFMFLCPANLVPKKGHRYLFEACKKLADKGERFRCLISGDGPLEDELKRLVDNLKLNEYIEFSGRLSHEAVLDLYNSGRVNAVVLPSIVTENGDEEGIPVALMEAMSYGIPVISTQTGGIPELIGDGSGIMVREKDPEALANAIEVLMKDPDYYRLISEQGRKKIEKDFNIAVVSSRLLKLFAGNNYE